MVTDLFWPLRGIVFEIIKFGENLGLFSYLSDCYHYHHYGAIVSVTVGVLLIYPVVYLVCYSASLQRKCCFSGIFLSNCPFIKMAFVFSFLFILYIPVLRGVSRLLCQHIPHFNPMVCEVGLLPCCGLRISVPINGLFPIVFVARNRVARLGEPLVLRSSCSETVGYKRSRSLSPSTSSAMNLRQLS